MKPKVDPQALKETKPWEYIGRFLFGGAITAIAGWVAHAYGPVVGGLFLGFPAILPCTLTLVKHHDGRKKAVEDARGAVLGSVGLIVFAGIVWGLIGAWAPGGVLLLATAGWLGVSVALWRGTFGR